MDLSSSNRKLARFGLFEADLQQRLLSKGGLRIRLQDQPFSILALLLEQPGQLVSREQIHQQLWAADTFVEFDDGLNTAIKKLRTALGDASDNPRFIETIPRRGYRFIAPVTFPDPASAPKQSLLPSETPTDPAPEPKPNSFPRRELAWAGAGALVLFLVFGALNLRDAFYKPDKLTPKDTVILADFVNITGEPVFGDALKQALSVQLEQSPFLNVESDAKVADALRRMGRSPNSAVTSQTALEACQRLGSKAVLTGSIAGLGSHYAIGLQALACGNGQTLAKDQAEAADKESVLKALTQVATHVRSQLGESLSSIQKFDFSVDATTTSLEALKAYSLGAKKNMQSGEAEAIPFFQRAIQLDPNFALAYVALGTTYENLGEEGRAAENYTKAYNLQARLSERERFHIAASYHAEVTGNLEKALAASELWTQSYPRDAAAHSMVGALYAALGQYDKAKIAAQASLLSGPESSISYGNLAALNISLNHLDEASATLNSAFAQKLDGLILRENQYSLAFLRGDATEMARQVAWAQGKPGAEDQLLSQQSDTEAFYGRLAKARELSRQAVASAVRDGARETAATWQMDIAFREAELGNTVLAHKNLRAALALSSSRDIKMLSALVMARIGNASGATKLIQELESKHPDNTILKFYWLPTLRAAVALKAGNTSEALSQLQITEPYELGEAAYILNMFPVYLRGQAYLTAHNGKAATVEFQKMLDHPGILQNDILAALSRLQLARAKAMAGDQAGAKKQYQDFLSLWQEADQGIPILVAAQAERKQL